MSGSPTVNNASSTATSTVGNIVPVSNANNVKKFSFEKVLTFGMIDDDVKALQIFLNNHGFPLRQSGPGSFGNETSYFGAFTSWALAAYQSSVGLPAVGQLGPKTRAVINTQ